MCVCVVEKESKLAVFHDGGKRWSEAQKGLQSKSDGSRRVSSDGVITGRLFISVFISVFVSRFSLVCYFESPVS